MSGAYDRDNDLRVAPDPIPSTVGAQALRRQSKCVRLAQKPLNVQNKSQVSDEYLLLTLLIRGRVYVNTNSFSFRP